MTYAVDIYYICHEQACLSKLINVKDILKSDYTISFVHDNGTHSVFNKSVVIKYTIMEEEK